VDAHLAALRSSVDRLRHLIEPLDESALVAPAYPTQWSVADVLSHIGSGAVILQRRLEDGLAGSSTPDDFAPSVWEAWNSKSPRVKADDALAADGELLARLEALTGDERARFTFSMGPMSFDIIGFVGLRLNEHALHTWDIEVATDPTAVLPADVAGVVIDNLELVVRFTAKPTGDPATIVVRISAPERHFTRRPHTRARHPVAGDVPIRRRPGTASRGVRPSRLRTPRFGPHTSGAGRLRSPRRPPTHQWVCVPGTSTPSSATTDSTPSPTRSTSTAIPSSGPAAGRRNSGTAC
jgi:uncharacterized protein (TIGR03083 family)